MPSRSGKSCRSNTPYWSSRRRMSSWASWRRMIDHILCDLERRRGWWMRRVTARFARVRPLGWDRWRCFTFLRLESLDAELLVAGGTTRERCRQVLHRLHRGLQLAAEVGVTLRVADQNIDRAVHRLVIV